MSSIAALAWQKQLYSRVSREMKLPEIDEIPMLRFKADMLRNFGQLLLTERFD